MWTTAEIVAVIVVGCIILSFPLLYNLFGKEYKKEGECGTETLWDRIVAKFKKKDKSE